MTHLFSKALGAAALAFAGFSASAASVNYTGNLGDSGNPYLRGAELGAPVFVDPGDPTDNSVVVANNVALYQVDITQAGALTITSDSLAHGGIDSLVSLFAGSNLGATLVGTEIDDFTWTLPVTPGWYWVAIGDWNNDSFADNLGAGTLGDGFIGLGQAGSLGDGSYDVTLSLDTGTAPIPEPSQSALLALGVAALATRAWRARRAG
jgi:hypothetical protein